MLLVERFGIAVTFEYRVTEAPPNGGMVKNKSKSENRVVRPPSCYVWLNANQNDQLSSIAACVMMMISKIFWCVLRCWRSCRVRRYLPTSKHTLGSNVCVSSDQRWAMCPKNRVIQINVIFCLKWRQTVSYLPYHIIWWGSATVRVSAWSSNATIKNERTLFL